MEVDKKSCKQLNHFDTPILGSNKKQFEIEEEKEEAKEEAMEAHQEEEKVSEERLPLCKTPPGSKPKMSQVIE